MMKDISDIQFKHDCKITASQFIDVLNRSGLAARRPVDDENRIETMLKFANILITAWDDNKLVGACRSLTDFSYCTYLSDLAVDKAYQKQGIGKKLIEETHIVSGKQTSLILLSAPDAMAYYPHIGMETINNGFVIKRIK